MNLVQEDGEYYSQRAQQKVFYKERVDGTSVVKTPGNWFYNHLTDRFISLHKFEKMLENDEIIDSENNSPLP